MAGFWATHPVGRVVRLVGVSLEAIELALDPLPPDAPAVVTCRPRPDGGAPATVAAVLDRLEEAALGLYPAWLPGAQGLNGGQGARIAAVRALALRKGAATPQFGPFLAGLAERALGTAGPPNGLRLAAEVRAAGLARVIADSFGRRTTALLVPVPEGLSPVREQTLVAACEWLAGQGGFGVWLTGAEVSTTDRVAAVRVQLPVHLPSLPVVADAGPPAEPTPEPPAAAVSIPPLAGRPHPGSTTEQALEAALAGQPWAAGRVWNQTYQASVLNNPVRIDLLWAEERCAVEIDGPDRRGALKYEADRRRDVQLLLAGFAVLRFTNRQVGTDLATVLSQINQILTVRREGNQHGG